MLSKGIKLSRTVLEGVTLARVMTPKGRAKWLVGRIQDMGPTYVKLGQFLSSRSDILGPDDISELKTLQDAANPLSWDTVKFALNGLTLGTIDKIPIASASIGQVHRATLVDGTQVVVKIRRPNIVVDVVNDIAILEKVVGILSFITGPDKMADTRRVLVDIKNMILNETDFEREVRNMQEIKTTYPEIIVPFAYLDMCNKDMIVMQYVPSVKFTESTQDSGKRSKLAYDLMDIFVKQFLLKGRLHADPTESNVTLSVDDLDTNTFIMYDLGHIVKLDVTQRTLMKILVFEMMTEDVDGVIDAMERMPEIIKIRDKPKTREFVKRYIEYIKTIDIRILSKLDSRDDILPIEFSSTVFEIIRVFGIVEGTCLALDPNFQYDKVFYKYVDTLVLDRDFLEYKARRDLQNMFKVMKIVD